MEYRNKKLFILTLILLSFAFGFHFGKKYYKKKTNLTVSKEDKQELLNLPPEKELKTAIHILNYYQLDNFDLDHFEILDEKDLNNIQIIGIKGVGSIEGHSKYKIPLEVYKVNINLNKKSITKKLIYKNPENYRATDIIVTEDKHVFISYLAPNNLNQVGIRIFEIDIDSPNPHEKLIYQSQFIEAPYAVHISGGIMYQYDKDNILVSIGDLMVAHYDNNDKYDLGKILLINYKNNPPKKRIFTRGNRNPQGLTFSHTLNTLIETEHGPEGGDEINFISDGLNYGWPNDSYGKPYFQDPSEELFGASPTHYGHHDNKKYIKPIYAFIPSIGTKAIEQMPKSAYEFPQWKDNFFMCSSKGLYRFEIIKEKNIIRLVFAEPLAPELWCRDLKFLSNGTFITDRGFVVYRKKGPRG